MEKQMTPWLTNITDALGNVWRLVPVCQEANCTKSAHRSGTTKHGVPIYRKRCYTHHNQKTGNRSGSYTQHKKDYCENTDARLGIQCTAPIVTRDQLEVDHIDGDHGNDNPNNLQTLCANCHRIKTAMESRGYLQGLPNASKHQDELRVKIEVKLTDISAKPAMVGISTTYHDVFEA
jgi:5-methylcytosine-specific restriction endonuclease McrA